MRGLQHGRRLQNRAQRKSLTPQSWQIRHRQPLHSFPFSACWLFANRAPHDHTRFFSSSAKPSPLPAGKPGDNTKPRVHGRRNGGRSLRSSRPSAAPPCPAALGRILLSSHYPFCRSSCPKLKKRQGCKHVFGAVPIANTVTASQALQAQKAGLAVLRFFSDFLWRPPPV